MKAPNGLAEIIAAYGDPRPFMGDDGVMSPPEAAIWEASLQLVTIDFPQPLQLAYGKPGQMATKLRCHPAAAEAFGSAFRTLEHEGLWPELKTWGGCLMVRPKRVNGDLSTHSWAIAIDVDVLNNPLGGAPRINPAVVRIFQAAGLTWGGEWRTPDPMHFQAATGY